MTYFVKMKTLNVLLDVILYYISSSFQWMNGIIMSKMSMVMSLFDYYNISESNMTFEH